MELNRKNQFPMTLKAILVNDKLNKDNHKAYETFGHHDDQYIIFEDHFNGDELYRAIRKFLNEKKESVNVDFDSFLNITKDDERHCTIFTILISAIEYVESTPWTMKSKPAKKPTHNVLCTQINDYKTAYEKNLVVAKAQTFTRHLQDMPPNLMVPVQFIEEVKAFYKDIKNVTIKTMDMKELSKKGMNLFVGVGKAATDPRRQPHLITIEYNGNPTDKDTKYAFVGKGVCFDAGGYSLKPGGHMRNMKYDMSGAAAVAGSVYAMAKNGVKANVVGVMPLVMNLIGQDAQLVDDIIKSYSGKTVEIDNTDAEGRLILADSLYYAATDLKATHLIDIATLTGAMVYALGETYSGVWTTSDCLWNKVECAAHKSGELVWRLPFHHDFKDLLKAPFADIANSCSSPLGGSSRAAMFLKEFTNNVPYIHFDVAGTADAKGRGAGIMVKTFYKMAMDQASDCCKCDGSSCSDHRAKGCNSGSCKTK